FVLEEYRVANEDGHAVIQGKERRRIKGRFLRSPAGAQRSARPLMVLAGLTVLLGWAVFYGSVVTLIVSVLGWTATNCFKVPQEERGFEVVHRFPPPLARRQAFRL